MVERFLELIYMSERMGNVTDAQLYEDGNMFVSGTASDGRGFSASITFKEEKKDEQPEQS